MLEKVIRFVLVVGSRDILVRSFVLSLGSDTLDCRGRPIDTFATDYQGPNMKKDRLDELGKVCMECFGLRGFVVDVACCV